MTPRWKGRLIYFKVLLEFAALIFFAVASGLCFTTYLTARKIKNDFKGIYDKERTVLLSAAIIYAIMFILIFLACFYTVHLTSDYFDEDDYFYRQLWTLLGLDKEKLPLPSPFDEISEKNGSESALFLETIVDEKSGKDTNENAYLEPIVHIKGHDISEKQLDEANLHDHEKPKGMFTFTYKGQERQKNRPEKMKFSETIITKIVPDNLDWETIILDKNSYPKIFDVYVNPSEIGKNDQEKFEREEIFDKKISTYVKNSENLGAILGLRPKNGAEKLVYKESFVSKIPSNVDLDQLIVGNIASIEKTLGL